MNAIDGVDGVDGVHRVHAVHAVEKVDGVDREDGCAVCPSEGSRLLNLSRKSAGGFRAKFSTL